MAGLFRVRTSWAGPGGSPWLTTLYYRIVASNNQAGADAARSKTINFLNQQITAVHTSVTLALDQTVDVLDEATGALTGSFTVAAFGGAGTATGDLLPLTTQGVLRINTSTILNGRRLRGKIFVPGYTEARNVAGAPDSVMIANTNTAAAQLLAGAADPSLAVFSGVVVTVRSR